MVKWVLCTHIYLLEIFRKEQCNNLINFRLLSWFTQVKQKFLLGISVWLVLRTGRHGCGSILFWTLKHLAGRMSSSRLHYHLGITQILSMNAQRRPLDLELLGERHSSEVVLQQFIQGQSNLDDRRDHLWSVPSHCSSRCPSLSFTALLGSSSSVCAVHHRIRPALPESWELVQCIYHPRPAGTETDASQIGH